MIDFGFDAGQIGLINQYFAVMIAVVALLAIASAARYYLVTTFSEPILYLLSFGLGLGSRGGEGQCGRRGQGDGAQVQPCQPRAAPRAKVHGLPTSTGTMAPAILRIRSAERGSLKGPLTMKAATAL